MRGSAPVRRITQPEMRVRRRSRPTVIRSLNRLMSQVEKNHVIPGREPPGHRSPLGKLRHLRESETERIRRPLVQLLVPAHQRAVGDRLPGGKRRESFSLRVQMESGCPAPYSLLFPQSLPRKHSQSHHS